MFLQLLRIRLIGRAIDRSCVDGVAINWFTSVFEERQEFLFLLMMPWWMSFLIFLYGRYVCVLG
jgi:hypothetical protein